MYCEFGTPNMFPATVTTVPSTDTDVKMGALGKLSVLYEIPSPPFDSNWLIRSLCTVPPVTWTPAPVLNMMRSALSILVESADDGVRSGREQDARTIVPEVDGAGRVRADVVAADYVRIGTGVEHDDARTGEGRRDDVPVSTERPANQRIGSAVDAHALLAVSKCAQARGIRADEVALDDVAGRIAGRVPAGPPPHGNVSASLPQIAMPANPSLPDTRFRITELPGAFRMYMPLALLPRSPAPDAVVPM